MLDWLIVGGGIHGTYLANFLIKTGKTGADKLRVVDPHKEPLAVWKDCTAVTGMEFLRSPAEHNLDVGAGALSRFGRQRSGNAEFYSKYQRPALKLFNDHCGKLIEQAGLADLRINASAQRLRRDASGFVLDTEIGSVAAKRVIVSIGASDCLSSPVWADDLIAQGSPIGHIFSPRFKEIRSKPWSKAVVVGGGISAAQLALALSREKPGCVTLIHARPLKTNQFDADPCWLDSRCLYLIKRHSDFAERRRIVDNARHRGSCPEEVRRDLEFAINCGALTCRLSMVENGSGSGDCVSLRLDDGSNLEADLVALATGHKHCLPGGALVHQMIDDLQLPCAPCGFPVIDEYLRWTDGLFVTGPLAELVVGPASRNIVGARVAAQRIASAEVPQRQRYKELNYNYFARRRTG